VFPSNYLTVSSPTTARVSFSPGKQTWDFLLRAEGVFCLFPLPNSRRPLIRNSSHLCSALSTVRAFTSSPLRCLLVSCIFFILPMFSESFIEGEDRERSYESLRPLYSLFPSSTPVGLLSPPYLLPDAEW